MRGDALEILPPRDLQPRLFPHWPLEDDEAGGKGGSAIVLPTQEDRDSQFFVAPCGFSTREWRLLEGLLRQMLAALGDVQSLPWAGEGALARPWRAALKRTLRRLAAFPPVFRYDSLSLERQQVNPDYEHLWIRLQGLSFGQESWDAFEFRFSCAEVTPDRFGGFPKLEFPQGHSEAPFEGWYVESEDDFGPKFELRFALPGDMDLEVWQSLPRPDRAFLIALIARLPVILEDLGAQGGVRLSRPLAQWTDMARAVQRIVLLSLSDAEPDLKPGIDVLQALAGDESGY